MHSFVIVRIVLGVHGAGLANVVFTAPGTTLMEITLPEAEVSVLEVRLFRRHQLYVAGIKG